mgnify:CR=1 FL=1
MGLIKKYIKVSGIPSHTEQKLSNKHRVIVLAKLKVALIYHINPQVQIAIGISIEHPDLGSCVFYNRSGKNPQEPNQQHLGH